MDDPRLGGEAQAGPLEEIPIAVTVRRATLSDRPAIARFIDEAYGPRAQYKATPRWTWQFIDNPFTHPEHDEVPVWVAVDGDRIVGQIAVQKGLLQVEDETFEAGWAVDIMLLQSHRGAGLGHRLHEAVVKDVDILMALTMAEASRRMAEREGCVTLEEVHQLTRWVRWDPVTVRRYLMIHTAGHRWAQQAAQVSCDVFRFHRLLPGLVNPLLRLRDFVVRSRHAPSATKIVEVDCFGPEVDELWERTRGDYPVIFARDSQFLNWRFVDCPEPVYRRFVAQRDGRTVGYVVLRRAEPVELQQGIIADLYASRQDTQTLDELVRHSLAFFGDTVSAVDCGTSVAEFEGVLRKHGFFKTWAHNPTCICRDSALRERVSQLKNDLFFSKGDQDWDQIHAADRIAFAE
ncbi:MAG TPA: GNAT family N-acetyltransferase [Solirubrobacteraceae bacterium]